MFKPIIVILTSVMKKILMFLITGIRPLLGPAACKFPVGCTQYAIEQLEQKRLFEALWIIIKRLLLCSPLHGVIQNMKQFFLSIMTTLSCMVCSTTAHAQPQSISITALDCNSETIRNKEALEHSVEIIAEHFGWDSLVHTHTTHTNNGIIITFYTDQGSVIMHCVNEKNMALIDIVKIKGAYSSLSLKNKVQEALKATKLRITVSSRA